jgi:hypothetical protein
MMRRNAITLEVRALEALELEGVRAAWRARYGAPPIVIASLSTCSAVIPVAAASLPLAWIDKREMVGL